MTERLDLSVQPAENNYLLSAWLKGLRARDLFKNLDAEMAEFFASDPFEYVKTLSEDREWINLSFTMKKPIPLYWSALLGDILHNLRSCLDHIVFGLRSKNLNATGDPSKVMFPVPDLSGDIEKKNYSKWIDQLTQSDINQIKNIGAGKDRNKIIWLIHKLDIIYKHRRLNILVATLMSIPVSRIAFGGPSGESLVSAEFFESPWISGIPFCRYPSFGVTNLDDMPFEFSIGSSLRVFLNEPGICENEMLGPLLATLGNHINNVLEIFLIRERDGDDVEFLIGEPPGQGQQNT